MLMLTGWVSGLLDLGFRVDGFWTAFWGALVVSLVSLMLSIFVREQERAHRAPRLRWGSHASATPSSSRVRCRRPAS